VSEDHEWRHAFSAGEPDEHGYSLLVPLIATASNGGSFDDDDFVAGAQVGMAWGQMQAGGLVMEGPYQRVLVPQLDLMAMHHGYTMTEIRPDHLDDDDEPDPLWAFFNFKRVTDEDEVIIDEATRDLLSLFSDTPELEPGYVYVFTPGALIFNVVFLMVAFCFIGASVAYLIWG
jgi:hypothetical protein